MSARDGLIAKRTKDSKALRSSGILDLEEELIRFLTANRTRAFLSGMYGRVLALTASLPEEPAKTLVAQLKSWRQQIDKPHGDGENREDIATGESASFRLDSRDGVLCEVCKGVLNNVFDFLSKYQYDLGTHVETQEEHAQTGGFCALHTWQYEQAASPQGTCTGYPRLLHQTAKILRSRAAAHYAENSSLRSFLEHPCSACEVRRATEDKLIRLLAMKITQGDGMRQLGTSALCLPHLDLLLVQILGNTSLHQKLLLREAAVMERVAEDMLRY